MKYREIYAALAKQRMDAPGFRFLKAQLMRPDDCIKRASKQCPNTILDFKENGGVLNASSTLPLTAGLSRGPAGCALRPAGLRSGGNHETNTI